MQSIRTHSQLTFDECERVGRWIQQKNSSWQGCDIFRIKCIDMTSERVWFEIRVEFLQGNIIHFPTEEEIEEIRSHGDLGNVN
jgi:hypothetical protein